MKAIGVKSWPSAIIISENNGSLAKIGENESRKRRKSSSARQRKPAHVKARKRRMNRKSKNIMQNGENGLA
jgi:hypothetical protein